MNVLYWICTILGNFSSRTWRGTCNRFSCYPVRNQADTLIHSTEKNLKEHGSKISDADKKSIEDGSNALKESLKTENIEDIKKKTETLVQASMKLGEAIYKSQQSKKPDSDKDDGKDEKEKKDDNVVDADFEEVKDENKEKSA